MYIAVGVFGISFAELFYFALFRVASVLEGTGKVHVMGRTFKNNKPADTSTVGGRIKKLRLDLGLSQEQLGYALGMEGKCVIYGYESNRRGVSWDVLVELARVLHITPEYIMTGSEPDEDPYVIEAAALIRSLKSDKAKKAALEHIKLVAMMER